MLPLGILLCQFCSRISLCRRPGRDLDDLSSVPRCHFLNLLFKRKFNPSPESKQECARGVSPTAELGIAFTPSTPRTLAIQSAAPTRGGLSLGGPGRREAHTGRKAEPCESWLLAWGDDGPRHVGGTRGTACGKGVDYLEACQNTEKCKKRWEEQVTGVQSFFTGAEPGLNYTHN